MFTSYSKLRVWIIFQRVTKLHCRSFLAFHMINCYPEVNSGELSELRNAHVRDLFIYKHVLPIIQSFLHYLTGIYLQTCATNHPVFSPLFVRDLFTNMCYQSSSLFSIICQGFIYKHVLPIIQSFLHYLSGIYLQTCATNHPVFSPLFVRDLFTNMCYQSSSLFSIICQGFIYKHVPPIIQSFLHYLSGIYLQTCATNHPVFSPLFSPLFSGHNLAYHPMGKHYRHVR